MAEGSVFRPDIQGMRAIAVMVVLVFHVFPAALPGGYVGVDVFFVISGFLITRVLLKQAEKDGRIRFLDFYARRARRLLPAAFVVLIAVASLIFLLPGSRWIGTANEIAASALYAENWYLALQAVDYLNSANPPSPLQHFWSLSIEEQFYFIWPALIALCAAAAAMFKAPLRVLCIILFTLIIGVSLWFSVTLSQSNPAQAYFFSHTRFWELAAGGLAAAGLKDGLVIPRLLRIPLGLAGVAAIFASAYLFSSATPFPGYAALAPVVGTIALLMSGLRAPEQRGDGPVTWLLENRVSQWVGDISYSLYLVHWPFVVFYNANLDHELGVVEGIGVIAITLAIAHVSKSLIEDTFRNPSKPIMKRPSGVLASAFASIAVCGSAVGAIYYVVDREASSLDVAVVADYPGALSLTDKVMPTAGMDFYPPLTIALSYMPSIYGRGCHVSKDTVEPNPCLFGPDNASFTIALIGDSHAANWEPALELLAEKNGWRLITHTKSSCSFMPNPVAVSGREHPYPECVTWSANVMKLLEADPPDVVVFSQFAQGAISADGVRSAAQEARTQAVLQSWERLKAAGISVVAVKDTPELPMDPLECMARQADCDVQLASIAPKFDAMVAASERVSGVVPVLDFAPLVCPEGVCRMVIGNVLVWRDPHHITKTYAETMAGAFEQALVKAAPSASVVPGQAPVAKAPDAVEAGELRIVMTCDALSSSAGFSRILTLLKDGEAYGLNRGDRTTSRYESWTMVIKPDNTFSVTGEYTEGSPSLKTLAFSGAVANGMLNGAGRRGPRDCTIEGKVG
jgi:peptidoglycan/LPS O-acetylase OafA/YrhL